MKKPLLIKKPLGKGGLKDSPLRAKLKATSILKPEPIRELEYIGSGSWILNLALTNNIDYAYPIGRVVNPIGDYSTGKTLLACETVNDVWYNYHLKQKKKVKIYYDEPEHAFDMKLASNFNMPLKEIIGLRERLPGWKSKVTDFKHSRTVEDLYKNIMMITEKESKEYDLILYVLDSLDSVTDAREIKHIKKKGVESQDYGGSKARVLSQMFRTCIQSIGNSNVLLFIISQIRTNFGVMFGPKYTRAGGKALDFYATIIYWLKESGQITTARGINQGIGVDVHIDKNKIGSRYNTVTFDILHGYGIDNYGSAVNFLWDKNGVEKNGSYLVWNGKNYYKKELITKAANNPETAEELKTRLQEFWNELIAEASIDRKPKWTI